LDDYQGYEAKVDDDLEGVALRVVRGGSWFHDGQIVRSACRDRDFPGNRNLIRGFRVVAPGL
jgi:formylglycine-generating enzyme required for sulfatase activity